MAKNGRLGWVMSILPVLVAVGMALSDCDGTDMSLDPAGSAASNSPTPTVAKQVSADEQAGTPVDPRIVIADNGLGLSLLNLLDRSATGNIAISPTSIALAFEMLYNGAAGTTQEGMSQALELDTFSSAQDVDGANATLQAALMDADPSVTITIANSLWMHLAANPVSPSFTAVNQNYYAAEVGDLAGAPANVNAWVSQATNGLITQLLPSADYSRAVLVLANAIYFKGTWTNPFDPSATVPQTFARADGTQVTCQMMQQHGTFAYYQGANFQMVRLPYGKQHLSMIIILPGPGVSAQSFVASMTVADLDSWMSQLDPSYTVNLGLPKFKTSYTTEARAGVSTLPAALTTLGMGAAFDPIQADFSGIAPHLFVNDALHQTVVEVDEAGTVAAAATGISATSVILGPTATMYMNRPFFYAIRDDDNGALLFLGLLADPTAS